MFSGTHSIGTAITVFSIKTLTHLRTCLLPSVIVNISLTQRDHEATRRGAYNIIFNQR